MRRSLRWLPAALVVFCACTRPLPEAKSATATLCSGHECGDRLQVELGNVAIGESASVTIQVRNDGTSESNIRILAATWAGAANAAWTVEFEPAEIAPGASRSLNAIFRPALPGLGTATLELELEGASLPKLVAELRGQGEPSPLHCVTADPTTLDFGAVQVGCPAELLLQIQNDCAFAVAIESADSGASEGALTFTQRPVWPFWMAPGESLSLKVVWRPSSQGATAPSPLEARFPQLTEPLRIGVIGSGTMDAKRVDQFQMDGRPKADVLFVIDDSSSMASKADALSSNLAHFVRFAAHQSLDVRIAVTTASVCEGYPSCAPGQQDLPNGRLLPLVGGPRFVDPRSPDAEAVLARNLAVGSAGSDTEQPLKAMSLALSPELLAGHNQGFLRDEASLSVNIVTDGVDEDATPVGDYVSQLLAIKGPRRANAISVASIIPTLASPPSGCSYDVDEAGLSMRLRDVTSATGGVYDEICSPDWVKSLERIGSGCDWTRTRFFLSAVPNLSVTPEPIRVEIDGVPFPSVGQWGERRWAYNGSVNAVDFDPLAAPAPGTLLTIAYEVLSCDTP